jgi:hypothetical protein
MEETIGMLDKLGFLKYLIGGIGISIVGYAVVLVFGFMLGIVHYYKTKNAIALSIMCLGGIFISFISSNKDVYTKIIDFCIYISVAIVTYVVVWSTFRSRADRFQDTRVGKDDSDFFKDDFKKKPRTRVKK